MYIIFKTLYNDIITYGDTIMSINTIQQQIEALVYQSQYIKYLKPLNKSQKYIYTLYILNSYLVQFDSLTPSDNIMSSFIDNYILNTTISTIQHISTLK